MANVDDDLNLIEKNSFSHFWQNIKTLLNAKQRSLSAGANIEINGSIISANGDNYILTAPVNPSSKPSDIGAIWFDSSSSSSSSAPASFNVIQFFPVGSIYLTTGNVNPSTFLGGSWSNISQGRVLVGTGGSGTDAGGNQKSFTAGNNSGEYEHTLTVDEMAAHTHGYTGPAANKTVKSVDLGTDGKVNTAGSRSTGIATGSTGGGGAHNNVQPTYGLYVWQRTA